MVRQRPSNWRSDGPRSSSPSRRTVPSVGERGAVCFVNQNKLGLGAHMALRSSVLLLHVHLTRSRRTRIRRRLTCRSQWTVLLQDLLDSAFLRCKRLSKQGCMRILPTLLTLWNSRFVRGSLSLSVSRGGKFFLLNFLAAVDYLVSNSERLTLQRLHP